jgi:hypothetical protein
MKMALRQVRIIKIGIRKVGDILRFSNDYIAHLRSYDEFTAVGCCKLEALEEIESNA